MSHTIRILEKPTETGVYAIGGDPAEGLERGDDSVLEVVNCKTGVQAAEVQGKIEPVMYGELAFMLGTYYNNALVGIESNKDLTPVKVLFGLKYPNTYMEMAEKGRAYRSATDRLGWQTNLRTRPQLIAQGRTFMADGSVTCKSRTLVSQFKSFALHMGKFQGLPGSHDDLVMAWLIAIEMMKLTLMREDMKTRTLYPLVDGNPVEVTMEDVDEETSYEDKLVARVREKERDSEGNFGASGMGALV